MAFSSSLLPPYLYRGMAKKEKVQQVAKPLPLKKYKPLPRFGA